MIFIKQHFKQEVPQNKNNHNVNDIFKIPIFYNTNVQKLNDNIILDLELVESINAEESPIYENIFKPSNKLSLQVIQQISNYYTTDVEYLTETQQLTTQINSTELNTINDTHKFRDFEINDIVSLWEEIKEDTGFCEKYLYIDWAFAKNINNNSQFLQLMSLYNIASPILSLCLPIFVLILPFFIIKFKGINLGIKEYTDILKTLISNHAIFKIFTQFHEIDNTKKMYLLLSSVFYLFSIYQNILVCVRFYSNMQKIHNYLFKFKKYLAYTLDIFNYHLSKSNKLTKYTQFNLNLDKHKNVLIQFYNQLCKITPFSFSFFKITEFGHIMHSFYQIYDNPIYNETILYSFGFNGYFNMLCHIGTNINEHKLVKTTFTNKGKPIFKQMYYPKFINNKTNTIIKNNCNLNKNMIITGPNASGKTTTIKSALINIILSQQIGCGCFDNLKLTPYDKIHCYLNIPDTSGRDSLFQAEARRCKDIIDSINSAETPEITHTHFCIFDELYSGTNPEEAVISANAFMNYIVKHSNVTCILTTHYIKLCKKLSKNKMIQNYNMKTLKKNDNFQYTYELVKGISTIKGGLKVLHDMKYPQEILDLANQN
jgi:hypothetical protein